MMHPKMYPLRLQPHPFWREPYNSLFMHPQSHILIWFPISVTPPETAKDLESLPITPSSSQLAHKHIPCWTMQGRVKAVLQQLCCKGLITLWCATPNKACAIKWWKGKLMMNCHGRQTEEFRGSLQTQAWEMSSCISFLSEPEQGASSCRDLSWGWLDCGKLVLGKEEWGAMWLFPLRCLFFSAQIGEVWWHIRDYPERHSTPVWAGASGILRHAAILFSVTLPCSQCLSQVCGDTFSCGAIRDENPWLEILSVFRNVSPWDDRGLANHGWKGYGPLYHGLSSPWRNYWQWHTAVKMHREIKKPGELQTLPSFSYQKFSFPDDPNMSDLLCREVLPVTSGIKPGAALMLPGALSPAMK